MAEITNFNDRRHNGSTCYDNGFTMIVLDLDDTLIPTTIRQAMHEYLLIDIFRLLSKKSLQRLQRRILSAIEEVQAQIKQQFGDNHPIKMCIISNAHSVWLQKMIDCSNPVFDLLCNYLRKHEIPIRSAFDDTMHYIQTEFDDESIPAMMTMLKENPWMQKYTTISSLVNAFKNELKCECNQIISFGDGASELLALQEYSKVFGINAMHIQMLLFPSIYQLNTQWKYIKNVFGSLYGEVNQAIATENSNKMCSVYRLKDVFPNDNNRFCVGKQEQMFAVAMYVRHWISALPMTDKIAKIQNLAERSREVLALTKMTNTNVYNAFKEIVVNCLCCHSEISNEFDGKREVVRY